MKSIRRVNIVKVVDIKNLSLEIANKFYKENGLAFIVKDGKIKGFTR